MWGLGFGLGATGAAMSILLLALSTRVAVGAVVPRADNANPAPKIGTFFLLLFAAAKLPILGFLYLYLARTSEPAKTGFLVGFGLVYSVVVGVIAVRSARS